MPALEAEHAEDLFEGDVVTVEPLFDMRLLRVCQIVCVYNRNSSLVLFPETACRTLKSQLSIESSGTEPA